MMQRESERRCTLCQVRVLLFVCVAERVCVLLCTRWSLVCILFASSFHRSFISLVFLIHMNVHGHVFACMTFLVVCW